MFNLADNLGFELFIQKDTSYAVTLLVNNEKKFKIGSKYCERAILLDFYLNTYQQKFAIAYMITYWLLMPNKIKKYGYQLLEYELKKGDRE